MHVKQTLPLLRAALVVHYDAGATLAEKLESEQNECPLKECSRSIRDFNLRIARNPTYPSSTFTFKKGGIQNTIFHSWRRHTTTNTVATACKHNEKLVRWTTTSIVIGKPRIETQGRSGSFACVHGGFRARCFFNDGNKRSQVRGKFGMLRVRHDPDAAAIWKRSSKVLEACFFAATQTPREYQNKAWSKGDHKDTSLSIYGVHESVSERVSLFAAE